MKKLETIYINCNSNQDIAVPGNSHIWVIDFAHIKAHTSTMGCLAPLFHSAQYLDNFYCHVPYRVSCLINSGADEIFQKFKNEDQETLYDRLKWYIKNLLPPRNGIIFTFYTADFKNREYKQPWALTSMWPMKEENKPLNKYMTYHPLENAFFTDNRDNMNSIEKTKVYKLKLFYSYYQECLKKIKKICNENKLEFYPVNYTQKYEETYKLLLGSNSHFTYGAGTTTLSMACETPTFHIAGGIIGEKEKRTTEKAINKEGKLYFLEYDGNHPINTDVGHHKSDKGNSRYITRKYEICNGINNNWKALYTYDEVESACYKNVTLLK